MKQSEQIHHIEFDKIYYILFTVKPIYKQNKASHKVISIEYFDKIKFKS